MESVNKADILKNWLLSEGVPRDTLAEELGVSKRTVDNWCSGREIPPVKWARILEKMNKPAFCYSSVAVVPVRFTLSEWEQVKTKIPQGVNAEEFLRAVLLGGAYRSAEGVTAETDDPIPRKETAVEEAVIAVAQVGTFKVQPCGSSIPSAVTASQREAARRRFLGERANLPPVRLEEDLEAAEEEEVAVLE